MNIICIFATVEGFLIHRRNDFKVLNYYQSKCMRNTALWCNGSTTVFGSVRAGSSPARVTKDLDKKRKCFVRGNRMFLYVCN